MDPPSRMVTQIMGRLVKWQIFVSARSFEFEFFLPDPLAEAMLLHDLFALIFEVAHIAIWEWRLNIVVPIQPSVINLCQK